jgi:hypothetical protein
MFCGTPARSTGQARLALRPSKKSIQRMVETVRALTVRARTWQEATECRSASKLDPAEIVPKPFLMLRKSGIMTQKPPYQNCHTATQITQ